MQRIAQSKIHHPIGRWIKTLEGYRAYNARVSRLPPNQEHPWRPTPSLATLCRENCRVALSRPKAAAASCQFGRINGRILDCCLPFAGNPASLAGELAGWITTFMSVRFCIQLLGLNLSFPAFPTPETSEDDSSPSGKAVSEPQRTRWKSLSLLSRAIPSRFAPICSVCPIPLIREPSRPPVRAGKWSGSNRLHQTHTSAPAIHTWSQQHREFSSPIRVLPIT